MMSYRSILPSALTLPWFAGMVLSLLATAGCQSSQDRQLIHSTREHPANVTVIDTLRDRTLWRMEVPVDHQLELDFDRPGAGRQYVGRESPATEMGWRVDSIGTGPSDPSLVPEGLIRSGQLPLTGNPVRVQVNYRDELTASSEVFFRYDQVQ